MARTSLASQLARIMLLLALACFGSVAGAQSGCGGRGQSPCSGGVCNENFTPNSKGNRCVPCNNGNGNPCPIICGIEGKVCCETGNACGSGLECAGDPPICSVPAPPCSAAPGDACCETSPICEMGTCSGDPADPSSTCYVPTLSAPSSGPNFTPGFVRVITVAPLDEALLRVTVPGGLAQPFDRVDASVSDAYLWDFTTTTLATGDSVVVTVEVNGAPVEFFDESNPGVAILSLDVPFEACGKEDGDACCPPESDLTTASGSCGADRVCDSGDVCATPPPPCSAGTRGEPCCPETADGQPQCSTGVFCASATTTCELATLRVNPRSGFVGATSFPGLSENLVLTTPDGSEEFVDYFYGFDYRDGYDYATFDLRESEFETGDELVLTFVVDGNALEFEDYYSEEVVTSLTTTFTECGSLDSRCCDPDVGAGTAFVEPCRGDLMCESRSCVAPAT